MATRRSKKKTEEPVEPVVESAPDEVLAPEKPEDRKPPSRMVKVKIIVSDRCFYGATRYRLKQGETISVPTEHADWLVHTGRAIK